MVHYTDTTAGAFNKWTGVQNSPEELEYLKKDFELRFPDDKEKPDYGYLDQLKRVVDWVSDADDTKFKAEFEQYFNKEYTFKYYLFVLVMGMADNLGKNKMLNTWDGKIWYPKYYKCLFPFLYLHQILYIHYYLKPSMYLNHRNKGTKSFHPKYLKMK